MEARQYKELLRIQAVSIMNLEWYEKMRERYDSIIYPELAQLPPRPPGPVIDAGSEEARALLKSTFNAMKRGLGYGVR